MPTLNEKFRFSRAIDVVNLRAETEGVAVLESRAELARAFHLIRDAQIVKMDTLAIRRRLPWPKFKVTDSGFARIPWKLNEDNCYMRAEMAGAVLVDGGFPLPSAISVVSDQSRLNRETGKNEIPVQSLFPSLNPQAVLSISDTHTTLIETEPLSWAWHVGLGYIVDGELWILDPAMNYDGPIHFEDWYRRLAEGVPLIQVELGWPFGLAKHAGQFRSLAECVNGSAAEKIFLEPETTVTPLSRVYQEFQTEILSAFCHKEIDQARLDELTGLLRSVAGPMTKKPSFSFSDGE